MQKLLLFTLAAFLLIACGQSSEKNTADQTAKKEKKYQELSEILNNAESLLGNEVHFKGLVTHTCRHSGRRCFVKSNKENISIRVEASGNITGFNHELSGEEIAVSGILRVNKLTKKYIDDWEEKLKAEFDHEELEEGGEHCSAEINNIKEMREWMKKNKKDYYPVYYVDGTDYEVITVVEEE